MPRQRGRKGYRREGSNITMTGVGLSLLVGAALYMATGVSIFPPLAIGLLTLAPGLYLAYRGMLIRGLGAVMLLSAFAGSLAYVTYLPGSGPGDPLYSALADPATPLILALLGLLTGGVVSYLGSVYQWAWLLDILPAGDPRMLAHGILSWGLLTYTTILAIALLRARSLRQLMDGGSLVIVVGAASILIMYIAHMLA